jgi:HEAT repeats
MRADLLRTLANNFGSNNMLAAKSIRELYRLDPAGFAPAVAEVLSTGPEPAGAQLLMAILVGDPDWLRTICNPDKYTLDQSLDLIQRAHKLDPLTELKLAEILALSGFTTDAETRFASRVFAVLKRSPPATVLPALRRLSKCENARIRSKAVLLLGSIYQNPKWAEQAVPENDPRVSANAVESLWGLATPEAREVFQKASRDKRHRIAANGMAGLYLMGDQSGISLLFGLSKSEAPLARAAAAWAMGHLEDPRFLPRLTALLEDPDPVARQRAFRSAARVRQHVAQMQAVGAVVVKLRDLECRANSHTVRVSVTQNDQFVKALDARQFVLWNGPDIVEEFSISMYEGTAPYYEITFQNPPSPMHQVNVQVYAAEGVGEDSGIETEIE